MTRTPLGGEETKGLADVGLRLSEILLETEKGLMKVGLAALSLFHDANGRRDEFGDISQFARSILKEDMHVAKRNCRGVVVRCGGREIERVVLTFVKITLIEWRIARVV